MKGASDRQVWACVSDWVLGTPTVVYVQFATLTSLFYQGLCNLSYSHKISVHELANLLTEIIEAFQ